MVRSLEVLLFSVFFLLSSIKVLAGNIVDPWSLTLAYYICMLGCIVLGYWRFHGSFNINLWLFFLAVGALIQPLLSLANGFLSIVWQDKFFSLILSLASIPIAKYMWQRNLLPSTVFVSTAFLLFLAVIFKNYVTHDRSSPNFILNDLYLHGSFLCGFLFFLSLYLRLPFYIPLILLVSGAILGGRGPALVTFAVAIAYGTAAIIPFLRRGKVGYLGVKGWALLIAGFSSIVMLFWYGVFGRLLSRFQILLDLGIYDGSAARRLEHIDVASSLIGTHPMLGIGFSNYASYAFGDTIRGYPHNLILEVLAESGILGGFLFLTMIVLILVKSRLNSTWPLVTYVLGTLMISYSYADSNELFFALTLAVLAPSSRERKNGHHRNYSVPPARRYPDLPKICEESLR